MSAAVVPNDAVIRSAYAVTMRDLVRHRPDRHQVETRAADVAHQLKEVSDPRFLGELDALRDYLTLTSPGGAHRRDTEAGAR